MQSQLIFVYNADSGLFNTVTDIAHKIISPDTYSCQLCSLTHSYFSIKKDWTDFLQGLDAQLEFLHRDELQDKYAVESISLPVILIKQGDQLNTWISTEEISNCPSIEVLKALIDDRLRQSDTKHA